MTIQPRNSSDPHAQSGSDKDAHGAVGGRFAGAESAERTGVPRVVIVGAGPRGLSAVERLVAHAQATGQRVHIDLIDPFPPGPGHVWRVKQSPRYLMNTPSLFPTIIADDGVLTADTIHPLRGMTFEAWRQAVIHTSLGAGSGADSGETPDPSVSSALSHEDIALLAAMEPTDFPQRRVYGLYLAWVFKTIQEQLPAGVELVVHREEAVAVRAVDRGGYRFAVEISGQQELPADHVVLALGHLDAHLRRDQKELVDGAAEHGLHYRPPAVPADVRWEELPAEQTVLVRGMGLNFHDVVTELTEGRGGRFEAAADESDRLVYVPSGHEPFVVVGSRRGTPYRAKAEIAGYYARSLDHKFLTREAVADLATGPELVFDRDLLPLVRKDATRAYYRTLARVRPGVFDRPAQQFLVALDEALGLDAVGLDGAVIAEGSRPAELPGSPTESTSTPWDVRVERLVNEAVAYENRLNIKWQSFPFLDERFTSHEQYAAALVHWLDRDAAGSAAGEDDPAKVAFSSLNWSRTLIKQVVAERGLQDESWYEELMRSFSPLVEGLASGPPALRIRQLAALARAGVVRFLGPNPVFRIDAERGCFEASSPWVADEPYRAAWLVEAMSPPNEVRRNISPLLTAMHDHGLVRAKSLHIDDGAADVPGPGLDVTPAPYRAIGTDGVPRDIWVLGLQLASTQWGTSIAAEAHAPAELGSRTLADADRMAAAVLS
ncbi:FAD/NAD(P)-binding protein [Kocuria sp.]|uniref:FAD/NAD(P)-binding protein n=1 Tax=Kocuria sp. TaxID=1871328 RepID=UPI0026DEBED9|nr:FAD/NAD(P)-binding protein [Kocuria sp.]MDO5617989.1 FAD/NAD(P)-binding protein [Kocuria sp.]